jgi:hypothetical protein
MGIRVRVFVQSRTIALTVLPGVVAVAFTVMYYADEVCSGKRGGVSREVLG